MTSKCVTRAPLRCSTKLPNGPFASAVSSRWCVTARSCSSVRWCASASLRQGSKPGPSKECRDRAAGQNQKPGFRRAFFWPSIVPPAQSLAVKRSRLQRTRTASPSSDAARRLPCAPFFAHSPMDPISPSSSLPTSLPAQKLDASGRARVDLRSIVLLAAPFAANSAIQSVLNLTDTLFIGHISTSALAAIAAVHWPVIVCIALFGGVGLAGQPLVAQATGARRYTRASQAGWISLWAVLFVSPIFIALGYAGRFLLQPFGLAPEIESQALEFWQPRMY